MCNNSITGNALAVTKSTNTGWLADDDIAKERASDLSLFITRDCAVHAVE